MLFDVAAQIMSLSTPGSPLSARVWGPEDGVPVLAIHGWLDNACSFDALAPRLGGFRIVALDLPGHGKSAHHAEGHLYAFVDFVADVFWAVEALGWSRFAVLGHSLGAAVGSVFAGTFPERVSHLMLLDAIGPATEEPEGAPERLAKSLIDQQRRRRVGSVAPVVRRREQLIGLAQAAREMRPESVALLLEGGIRDADSGFTWSTDPMLRLGSRMRLTEGQVLGFLRRITCPTLLIRAEGGIPIDPSMLATRIAAVPKLETRTVEGRHHVHLDAPERVAPLLLAFVQEHPEPQDPSGR